MRIFKNAAVGGYIALIVLTLGVMFIWNAMAGSEGTPNNPPNSERHARAAEFGPVHILVGVTADESDGSTVNIQGLSKQMIVSRDSGGTSVVTPEIKPAQGNTVAATDWIPLDAITLSGTTSQVDFYPGIIGNYSVRFVVTSCSSCNVDLWWSGIRGE